jgi:hypothetical protein
LRARACARLSEHLVSVPAATLSARKGGGDERECIGPLLSADGCARAHTHIHSARAHTDDTRGSGGRHAQGRRPRTQTHRRRSRAACDRCPCPRNPMLCRYLVLLHSPDTCSSSSSCSDAMRMRVLAACAAPHSLQDLLLNKTLLSLFSFILLLRLLRLRPGSLSPRTSARLGLRYAKLNVLIIHVKSFYSKTLSRPRSAGRRPGPPL